jgi:mannosyltransferase
MFVFGFFSTSHDILNGNSTQRTLYTYCMSRSQAFWILICIVGVGIALRSYDLTLRSLWFDEAFSWRLIQFPFSEMMTRAAADVHPPLYYIFLRGWSTVFGSSLVAIRSFSVFCAGLSLFAAYLYAAYAFRSRRAGIYAAVLLAISPWAISYAWEARMYPLGMIFTLLSSYALLRGVRDKSFWWFGAYGVAAAALVYTHYYGFFTIAAHVVFVLTVLIQSTRWRVGEMAHARIFWAGLLSLVVALLLFAPWLPVFLQQRSQVQEAYWIPALASSSVPDTFYHFFVPTLHIPPHHGLTLIVSLLPIVGTLLLWMYALLRYRKMDGVSLTVFLGVIPIVVSVVISLTGRSLYNDRFFAFTGIFIFILLGYVISALKKPVLRRTLFFVAIVGLLLSFARYWDELDIAHKGGSYAAASQVFTQRTADEPVLVSSPFVYFAILHYATEEFNSKEATHLYSKTGTFSHFSGGPITTQEDIAGPQDIAQYKGNVWFIDTTGFSEQPFTAPANWRELSKDVYPEVFVHQGDVIVRKFSVR